MDGNRKWYANGRLWVELFVVFNLAGLAGDIYLAHSTNSFRHSTEFIPFAFSIAAPLVLAPTILLFEARHWKTLWMLTGHLVGWLAVAIGVAGMIFHLQSRFFLEQTLDSRVYAAPFAAPLSYTGLGLL